jgi:endoglucanase
MASSSMIIHGICLLRVRLPRKSTQPVPAQPYVVRVLIPCYTESLEIVQKTVLAAANADLPPLACRTVYLLDDGKDVSKAAWVAEQGREDIVYISGRVRAKGETNGKACNLNNTLHQLYPKDVPVDDMEATSPPPHPLPIPTHSPLNC